MRLDTGLLLGLLTAAVTALGIVLSRKGQAEQARQQKAANDLADRAESFDEMVKLVAVLNAEIQRLGGQITNLETGKDEAMRSQAVRCKETLDGLVDTVATLQSVVQDEVARAAAFGSIGIANRHLEEHADYLEDPPRES